MNEINHTHAAAACSWVESAQLAGADFPIQNLPIAVFRRASMLDGAALDALQAAAQPTLNDFMAQGPSAWRALRHALFAALHDSAKLDSVAALRRCLVARTEVEFAVPARIGDYTDFYTSLDHARNVTRLMNPQGDVTPNFHWLPIAYHGRASTVGVCEQRFRRPMGQALLPGASAPTYQACTRLDYELELGVWIGPGNAIGEPIPIDAAEQHVFGIYLLNDWSARDIQFWEMAPLGPFLGKNFATTISPWIVSMDALAPYRLAWQRDADAPQPLAYLDSAAQRERGALDIRVEA